MNLIRIIERLYFYFKPFLQRLIYRRANRCRLMIMGCQRSGTNLLNPLFSKQLCTSLYAEASVISNIDPYNQRLNPVDDVLKVLNSDPAPLVIIKPLAESQNAKKWLEHISDSKILWQFRNPIDVAYTSIQRFGPESGALNKLRLIVESKYTTNPWTSWITENTSEKTRNLVAKYYRPDMNPFDAVMLFWYCRNILFFEQGLENNNSVLLLSYSELLNNNRGSIERLNTFINLPSCNLKGEVIHLKPEFPLPPNASPAIFTLCDELYQRLLKVERSTAREFKIDHEFVGLPST